MIGMEGRQGLGSREEQTSLISHRTAWHEATGMAEKPNTKGFTVQMDAATT